MIFKAISSEEIFYYRLDAKIDLIFLTQIGKKFVFTKNVSLTNIVCTILFNDDLFISLIGT